MAQSDINFQGVHQSLLNVFNVLNVLNVFNIPHCVLHSDTAISHLESKADLPCLNLEFFTYCFIPRHYPDLDTSTCLDDALSGSTSHLR